MIETARAAVVVLDASAMVDLLIDPSTGNSIRLRLQSTAVHVPALLDAEVLPADGRLSRAGQLTDEQVAELLGALGRAPFARHHLQDITEGPWWRCNRHRLVDALYELAEQLRAP